MGIKRLLWLLGYSVKIFSDVILSEVSGFLGE